MREVGILLASMSIAIGILLLVAPQVLVRLGEQTNRLYNIDGSVFRHRYAFGAGLIFAAIFMVYSVF